MQDNTTPNNEGSAAIPVVPEVTNATVDVRNAATTPAAGTASATEPAISSADVSTQESAPAKANFSLNYPYSGGDIPFDPELPVLSYPSANRQGTVEAIKRSPNLSKEGDERLRDYGTVIRGGLSQLPQSNDMNELVGRVDASFTQAPAINGQELTGAVPKFKLRQGIKPTGESARNLVRSSLNMGTVFSIPLWHSGFWVTVRSPSEGALLELHRQLTQDKTTLGRATYGLMFSQTTSYSAKALTDFFMAHLHSSSLEVPDNDSILNYIHAPDYQLLLWGLACATWPSGYQYQRACISDVEKCNHVVTERINLARLQWTDTSALSEKQLAHMTHRQKQSVTLTQVKNYQDEFLRGTNAKIVLNDKLSMVLKMPMLTEFIDAGYRWIGALEEQYGRAMGLNEEERNTYLISHALAQAMRQYSHFVHSIFVDDEEIDDKADIEMILGDLSSQDDIRNNFLQKVQTFQNESIFSFIGIPNYKCPACGGMQNPKAIPGQKHELIPLDAAQTFFPLLMQKLSMINNR